ncbi:lipase 3 [Aphomia sociella]
MKAVCLLLCLALAREIAGSLFNNQFSPLERYAEPLENNQQHLKQHKNRQQQYRNQSPQQNRQQFKQQYGDQSSEQHQQTYAQQYMQQYGDQYQQQYPQQYLQPYASQKLQPQNQLRKIQRQSLHSESDESMQSSQVSSSAETSQERRSEKRLIRQSEQLKDELYSPSLYADENMPPSSETANNVLKASGDAIEWRGIKMADGPNSPVQNKEQIKKIFIHAQKSMKHVDEDDQKTFHNTYLVAAQANDEDIYLNATQMLKKNGYPVEEHVIKTEDGYFLTMFRILKQATRHTRNVATKGVVLLMHGLYGSADDWLLMGPKQSLAYLLADEGYDVFLANVRGNKYSRRHITKHPAQADFWKFSTDEIANVDLPAMIDHALKTSGQEKLHYVGYSQGTTVFFAMASSLPEYKEKIIKMHAIAPMVYMSNARSPMVRMMAPTSPLHEHLNQYLKDGEFKPNKELLYTMGGEMCQKEIGCKKICSNVNFVMSGVNLDHLEPAQVPLITAHLPAGGSTRQIKQYAQALASREFRMYDFGSEINQKVYGDVSPPVYDMSNIQTPVALYFSEEDWLVHPKDVERLRKELPNVTDFYQVPVAHFSHLDFQYYKKAPEVVYKRLIESMKNSQ